MSKLKKHVEVKIEGEYVKGKIINGLYISNMLVIAKSSSFDTKTIKEVIEELQELHDVIESTRVADKLSESPDLF